jgi:hypothetical protein
MAGPFGARAVTDYAIGPMQWNILFLDVLRQ